MQALSLIHLRILSTLSAAVSKSSSHEFNKLQFANDSSVYIYTFTVDVMEKVLMIFGSKCEREWIYEG